ncbi:ATP-binding cassette domain-containing protein [Isoptericola variabilis]|uniref:ATP-binding cassette domain-containing protein n=1 Tax=Isoptericola variabilis TaxID=139208 RepID=UPI0002E2AFB8
MAALHHLGRHDGRERADALLAQFGLTDAASKPVSTWSGGMRRKLDLAMTLVGSPAVVFLDEPTTGLDPRSRRTLWDEVRALVAAGTTILLTTQYLEEADQLADRIAVLDGGIMARFRTMAISPGSVLSGQVLGFVVQGLAAVTLVVLAAVAMGYRPAAGALDWLGRPRRGRPTCP